MTKIGLIQFLLLSLISAAWGQKVKYKDIYALLSTKQYEQAEPFLKRYVRENPDEASACLFMGNIFQDKASKNDVLKQTAVAIANMDSAILFYTKARPLMTEKEVRRNKEYYEGYNRRDLRTGEFGVKLSDIQFDLEKKVEGLKERIDRVKMVVHYFELSQATFDRANTLYVAMQEKYPSLNHLYLRADEQTLKDLTMLSMQFDSCVSAFEHYKSAAANLGKIGYNQQLSLQPIADFKTEGVQRADFFQDEVKVWEYKKFADHARGIIEKEVMPMQKHLVSYDMEINKLREKLNSDSVSVRHDLTDLVDKLLYDQLKQFDPEPLPMLVFALKTTDLAYRSTLLEHKSLRDSADIHLQVAMIRDELALLSKLDSIASLLPETKLDEKAVDYAAFISDTYSNASVLKSYVRSLKEFGLREQKSRSGALARQLASLNYIIDGPDSIPLISDVVSTYRPLVTTPEKFTVGLSLRDSTGLHGYFYTITASRKPEVKAYFPVSKSGFNPSRLEEAKGLAYTDSGEQIYYVLLYSSKAVQEKYPATLAKIYRSDGLAWKLDLPLSFTPSEMVLTSDTGELVIKDDLHETVVDKNGKVVVK